MWKGFPLGGDHCTQTLLQPQKRRSSINDINQSQLTAEGKKRSEMMGQSKAENQIKADKKRRERSQSQAARKEGVKSNPREPTAVRALARRIGSQVGSIGKSLELHTLY